jgi:hypothetical protein
MSDHYSLEYATVKDHQWVWHRTQLSWQATNNLHDLRLMLEIYLKNGWSGSNFTAATQKKIAKSPFVRVVRQGQVILGWHNGNLAVNLHGI